MNRNDGAVGDARKRGEALHSVESDAGTAMRYSIHRWAPTQPTPTLDYVLWLRETIPPEDIFALTEALTELGHAAEEHHQTRVEIAYVVEEIMGCLTAKTRVTSPGGSDV